MDIGIWKRPSHQFRSLPLDIRWEVTRRHSIYQAFWQPFNLNLEAGEEVQSHVEALLEKLAQYLLGAINVGLERPSPVLEFSELGKDDLRGGWMSGAVHPLTNRQLLSMLIACLPEETLGEVGLCMMQAGLERDIDGEPRKHREIRKLNNLECDGLDSYIDQPFVSINPAASSRNIKEDLSSLVAEWKRERGLTEQRVPSNKKLRTYLEVWDEREGWFQGSYVRSRESIFKEIANRRRVSLKTIHNQYRNAFQLITGHDYSVDNWIELFGSLKLSKIFGSLGTAGRLRPLIQQTRRAIPESIVSSAELPDFISRNSCVDDTPAEGLLSQIRELISAGKSNSEIADELDLQHSEVLLPLLRSRLDDLPS